MAMTQYTVDGIVHRTYVVQGTVTGTDHRGYSYSHGLPTIILDSWAQGLTTPAMAARVAADAARLRSGEVAHLSVTDSETDETTGHRVLYRTDGYPFDSDR